MSGPHYANLKKKDVHVFRGSEVDYYIDSSKANQGCTS